MKITIEGSPEEIERALRKLAARPRRTQLAPQQSPFHLQPIIGPQVVDPVYPGIEWPPYPYGTIISSGGPIMGSYTTSH
jgi:hypothetical protein